ncbi:hypothetical protein SAMN05421636_10192 [Pricia antarctica]|uniref:Long-chain fatty acid transport protein n=1 Tax=Pricia antarctica TaxID=641691 RepID=A0A1G6VWC4_9FLAO|nr:hypothetical protein [Pricia antarctica]SDD57889.1 hypothetical protein SAMN05421636_10192 [Pricia antarctica]
MIKKIGFVIACLTLTGMYAQDGSISPYSYFGLGDIRESTTVENQMMGGIGVYADSIHINMNNPAAYSKLGVQVRDNFGITTYTAGVSHKMLRFKSFSEEQSSAVTNLDYLALGVSLKKGLGLGFGIKPYSSVGYNFEDLRGAEGSRILNEYSGEGGINKVYASLGYEFLKDLSLGVTVNYNFGTIDSERVQSTENVQFGAKDKRSSRITGYDLNYALNYTPAVDTNHTLFTSVRINTQANLSARNTKQIGSFSLATSQDIELIDVNLAAQGLKNTEVKIPTTTTLGVGYGEDMKWFLGVEYSFQKLGDLSNEFLEIDNLVYGDASMIALGGFYTPDRNSFESYFKRITYRAGLRYDKTGMVVNNKDIKNLGITFGLGLPLGNGLSNLNLGFELGRRGTSAAGLIEESYFKVNIGLSLNDQWFQKRKIN